MIIKKQVNGDSYTMTPLENLLYELGASAIGYLQRKWHDYILHHPLYGRSRQKCSQCGHY